MGAALAIVYLAHSPATINHNAWGAELSSDPGRAHAHHRGARGADAGRGGRRERGARSPRRWRRQPRALPRFARGVRRVPSCARVTLAARRRAPPAARGGARWAPARGAARRPTFRRLLAVFVPSGIAAAIPSTLVLFFIPDVMRRTARGVPGAVLRRRGRRHAAVDPALARRSARATRGRSRWSLRSLPSSGHALLGPGDVARSPSSA